MPVIWFLLFGLISISDTFMLPEMTASLRTASEIFPALLRWKNDSSHDKVVIMPSSFGNGLANPNPHELYGASNSDYKNPLNESQSSEKVIVLARIDDYDDNLELGWRNEAETSSRNRSSDSLSGNISSEQSKDDHYLEKGNIQKYKNDYQDLLYTFKDFSKLADMPNVKEKSSEFANKIYSNLTFVMPISSTKQYFQITFPKLNEIQYNEVLSVFQKYLQNSNSSLVIYGGREKQSAINLDADSGKKRITSRALSESSNLKIQSSEKTNSPNSSLPSDYDQTMAFFYKEFSPDIFNDILKKSNITGPSFDTITGTSTEPPELKNTVPLLKNNGFHAEIATDYVHKHGEPSAQASGSSLDGGVGGDSTVLKHPRRNRTRLFLQSRSKRPIMNVPENANNRRYSVFNGGSVSGQTDSIYHASIQKDNVNSGNNENSTPEKEIKDKLPSPEESSITTSQDNNQNTTQNNSTFRDFSGSLLTNTDITETSSNFSKYNQQITSTLKPNEMENMTSQHIMEAAKWLIDMKKRIADEENKKNERHMNYIKQFLKNDDSSNLNQGKDGSVMKINKLENLLQEIKIQILEYFGSLELLSQETISNDSSSTIQHIMNATNVFELLEISSKFVKKNLQTKINIETIEPAGFIKHIADKQVEKCKNKHMNNSLVTKPTPNLMNKNKQRRKFIVFTKCVNYRIKMCVLGFSGWLSKGKFYLRPQFKMNRAFENFEIQRNLYCLRTYNPTVLDSNRHGVRVRPGPIVNRKLGTRRLKSRQNKSMFRIRKTSNKQHKDNVARTSLGRRKYEPQKNATQQPRIQRYTDKQNVTLVVGEQQKTKAA